MEGGEGRGERQGRGGRGRGARWTAGRGGRDIGGYQMQGPSNV